MENPHLAEQNGSVKDASIRQPERGWMNLVKMWKNCLLDLLITQAGQGS